MTEKPELTQPSTTSLLLGPQRGVSALHLGGTVRALTLHKSQLPPDFFLHVRCSSTWCLFTTGRLLAAFRFTKYRSIIFFETHRCLRGSASDSESRKECTTDRISTSQTIFFDGHAKNCPELAQLFCEPLQRNSSQNEWKSSTVLVAYSPYSTISITHRTSDLKKIRASNIQLRVRCSSQDNGSCGRLTNDHSGCGWD